MLNASLIAYISGHGFGHFTRSEAVLERVAAAGVPVHLRTDGRALALARGVSWAASVEAVDTGPGVVQRGPIELDLEATASELAEHVGRFDEIVAREARAIRALGGRAVYADVPPFAFEAAARAGVPSVGLANFSWSWIYAGYRGFEPFAARLERAERQATRFLAIPFEGGLEHFPGLERVPLVARRPTRSRDEARALLPVPSGETRPVVLLSFGGFGAALDLAAAAARNPRFFFVSFTGVGRRGNLASIDHVHGLPHQDLVLGADAILGKPGYGTLAEAIVARRAFVHCPRGDFREYPVLVGALERWLPSAPISTEELLSGEWTPALEAALAREGREFERGLDGAERAAAAVLEVIRSRP